MGATLVSGGATFKVWGPLAQAVYLNGQFGQVANWTMAANPALLLVRDGAGYWTSDRNYYSTGCALNRQTFQPLT